MKSTAIFLLGLSLCLPLSAQPDINAGLIAYYAFEGNTADSGPYGLDGVLSNASFTPGHSGLGLRILGLQDSFVEVAGDPVLSPQDEVSVSVWVKVLTPPPIHGGLIYKAAIEPTSNGFQDRSYALWIRNNGVVQISSTPEGASSQVYCNSEEGAVAFGEFVHLVGVVSAKSRTMTVYANRNKVLSCDYPGNAIRQGNYPLRIGAPFFTLSDQNALDAIVDEVRIYDRTLSDAEVE